MSRNKGILIKIIIALVVAIGVIVGYFVITNNRSNISKVAKNYAKEAISITDKMLDGEVTPDEAYYKVDSLSDSCYERKDKEDDWKISFAISSLAESIHKYEVSNKSSIRNEIIDSRNDLAELIGVKER